MEGRFDLKKKILILNTSHPKLLLCQQNSKISPLASRRNLQQFYLRFDGKQQALRSNDSVIIQVHAWAVTIIIYVHLLNNSFLSDIPLLLFLLSVWLSKKYNGLMHKILRKLN